jgi:uncharacterized BrkB/YihY/UPF0761 family membrane protein
VVQVCIGCIILLLGLGYVATMIAALVLSINVAKWINNSKGFKSDTEKNKNCSQTAYVYKGGISIVVLFCLLLITYFFIPNHLVLCSLLCMITLAQIALTICVIID